MPVSEIEKGVSTSGCRFSDKAEHVPIKKRRFLFRSPSPPPPTTISPCTEETADHTRSQDVSEKLLLLPCSSDINSGQIVDNDSSIDAKKSAKFGDRFDEDFSGISILAAAACSSSLGRDCGYMEDGSGVEESSVLERSRDVSINTEAPSSSKGRLNEDILNSSEMSSGATSSCVYTEPVGEIASISSTVSSSQEVATVGKDVKDASMGADSLTFSGDASFSKDEETVRNQGILSRDVRLHWDLNVVMDAWEQPLDDLEAQDNVAYNTTHDAWKANCSDKMESEVDDSREYQGSAYAAQSSLLRGEPMASANQSSGEMKDNQDFAACPNLEQPPLLDEKSLPTNSNLNLDVMRCMVEDTKCRHHQETVNPTDGLVVAVPNETIQLSASCTISQAEDASVKSAILIDKGTDYRSVMEGCKSNVGVASCELHNLKNTCASDPTFDAVSADTHMSLCTSSAAEDPILETAKISRLEENALVQNVDLKTVEPRELVEFAMANDDSGLPHNGGPDSMSKRFGTDAADELQEDYDSQYEDGELRESGGRAWEEYDAVDREAEHAEYVTNYREIYPASPTEYHVSESGRVEDSNSGRRGLDAAVSAHNCKNDKEVYRKAAEVIRNVREDDESNQIKSSHAVDKTELARGNKQLVSSTTFSDLANRAADANEKKNRMPSHIDGSLASRGTESRVQPKVFRNSLQSQLEGPVARDDAYREDLFRKRENRFDPGSMRSFERVRYPFQNQGRGRHIGSLDSSSDNRRGFRRHYSPITHGHSKFDHDAVVGRDIHGRVSTQDVSYSQLRKGQADAEGEPCVGFQSRYKGDRKFSPDRTGGFGRGRSFRYGPFVEGRGGRGKYNGPSPDESFQSSLKYRRPLSRREQSLSPFRGRGQSNVQHSRRKSPSRSRSRSPIIWNSPRRRLGDGIGGNTFLKQRSRSPKFRSEVRMQRPRSPQQQPGFGFDHAGGFRSISQNHGSPSRNRWGSAGKEELGHFREIGHKQRTAALDRSPGRIRSRGDRDSAVGSSRILKPDGYFRFSERTPDDAGRGARYEENFEERRKRYNPIRPARRNFDDGVERRLHQNINENFSMANNYRDRDASSFQDRGFRSMDSRIGDVPRRFRGENRSFMCERDGKYNPNTKQIGVDAMDSSHNLKSEEQC
ncbi:uncharacterized protein LOC104892262 [Beta vulgaris subsp. vulgaris]|uniref:uncharacterized protein LOC104892262 n=1 Tax=Beta vulgaris subsp. vulgaris TaxID=3555 RepID=UPI0020368A73|nr:uncharacterized protein LOC104892262 [Beta vulgaris subsp. vulgaris]XP_048501125.1 uncharacterized protein LOC104892262 [Beta vulgaris subsp. vulgaris]